MFNLLYFEYIYDHFINRLQFFRQHILCKFTNLYYDILKLETYSQTSLSAP